MRICDLQEDQVVVGLQIRSLVDPMRIGIIVDIDYIDDASAWIRWEGEDRRIFLLLWQQL